MFTRKRLWSYPCGALVGLTIGFLALLVTSDGLHTIRGGRVGGDFPAFYGAGQVVRDGRGQALYDLEVQREVQADLLPGHPGGWISFPYPPFVALAYAPFTLVSFKTAYVLYTILMTACCVVALSLLRPLLPRVEGYFVPAVATALTFYPLFRAVVGGQNTALSVLCAAGAAAALAARRDLVAGLWLGAWLFKPQLALTAAVLVIVAGRLKVTTGIAIAALIYYIVAAIWFGPAWPLWWWREGVAPFAATDLLVDRLNGVSLREIASDLGVPMVGWLAVGVVGAVAITSVWRSEVAPTVLLGIASSVAVLIAPHALYYDAGLAVLGLAAVGNAIGPRALPLLAAAWIFAAAQVFRTSLPFPPLTVVVILTFAMLVRVARVSGAPATPLAPAHR